MLYWWMKAGQGGHKLALLRSGLFFLARLDRQKSDYSLAMMNFEKSYIKPGEKLQKLIDLGLLSTLDACMFALRDKVGDAINKPLVEQTIGDIYSLMEKVYEKHAFADEALVHYQKSEQLRVVSV